MPVIPRDRSPESPIALLCDSYRFIAKRCERYGSDVFWARLCLQPTLGTGARQGVLIKGGIFVEELAKVTVVALDKTGTLTRGEPEVTEVTMLPATMGRRNITHAQFLAVAAGIERRSGHPLAKAIVRFTDQQAVPPAELTDFKSLTGAGASARLDGRPSMPAAPSYVGRGRACDLNRFGLTSWGARVWRGRWLV